MVMIDRRTALALGAAGAAGLGMRTAAAQSPAQSLDENPVLFWNAVSLELVALDHSIDPEDARAPGPCASSYALGLIHAVIADAVSIAYKSHYKPHFYKGRTDAPIQRPELFVGGAAEGILSYIFNSPIHSYTIGASRQFFQRVIGRNGGRDWQAGQHFARLPVFTERWKWVEKRPRIIPQLSRYVPGPRRHNIDPYNAGQGFYGYGWGQQEPLVVPGGDNIVALAPKAPPPEGSPEYERDLAEVAVVGALESKGNARFPARTPAQTSIGLFWAYDGARLIGTPPRLYNQIVRQIAIDDGMSIPELARLLAFCNLAMADAGIVCWWAKYHYAVWRPVLGIQNHLKHPQPNWRPLGSPKTNPLRFVMESWITDTAQSLMGGGASILAQQLRYRDQFRAVRWGVSREEDYSEAAFTPNFPAYPSGHATFGAACFHILRKVRAERRATRNDPDKIDREFISDEINGIAIDNFRNEPRPYHRILYTSIEDMIKDNDNSRVYLGVHWRFDCTDGTVSGKRIADSVYRTAYGIAR